MLRTNAKAIPNNDVHLESVSNGGAWHRLTAEDGRRYYTLCGITLSKLARRDKWTGNVSCSRCLARGER